jgi:predicted solute-binding protein
MHFGTSRSFPGHGLDLGERPSSHLAMILLQEINISVLSIVLRFRNNPSLFLKEHAEEAAMDRQSAAVVVDKTELPELLHIAADPGSGCADHLCQGVLVYFWNYRFRSALLAKMSESQEDPSQPLFARVEKLVDKIRFVSDVA